MPLFEESTLYGYVLGERATLRVVWRNLSREILQLTHCRLGVPRIARERIRRIVGIVDQVK